MADVNIRTADAIILRKYPFRETSLLLILYTKEYGKIKGIIKGIRGPRGQFGSFPEIFTLNKVVFYESKRREFFYVTECSLIDLFQNIRLDLERTGYATYLVELTDAASPFNDKNEELFDLLLNSLRLLCSSGSAKRITRIFEIKLLLILGLTPALDSCMQCGRGAERGAKFSFRLGGLLCQSCHSFDKAATDISPGTVNFISHIEKTPHERTPRIKVSKKVGQELEYILRRFLDMHIDKKLKTLEFLRKIEAIKG